MIRKVFNYRLDLMVIFVIFIFNLFLFNKYFPLTEGWWETYAYLFNNGLSPSTDFEIAFPPLFIYINSVYLDLFGKDFYTFRLIGVFLFTIQSILLLMILKELFSTTVSSLAVLLAEFLFISMPIFIAKDYHTYVYLFEFMTILLFLKSVKSKKIISQYLLLIVSTIFVTLLFLIKQNIGLVLFVSILTSIYLTKETNKEFFIKFILILIVFISFFLFSTNIIPFDSSVITNNDSKGSMMTVATRFIFDEGNRVPLIGGIIIFIIFQFLEYIYYTYYNTVKIYLLKTKLLHSIKNYLLTKKLLSLLKELNSKLIIYQEIIYIFIGFIIFLIIFPLFIEHIITLVIAIVLYLLFNIFSNKSHILYKNKLYLSILIPIVGISYCNTHTTTFDYGGLLIVIAFVSAFLFSKIKNNFIKLSFAISILYFVLEIISIRIVTPYHWWENAQASILSANELTDYKALDNIYVDKNMQYIYNGIKYYMITNSTSKYDTYFFNVPLLYILNEKLPPYKLVGHWFDVTPTNSLKKEYNSFIDNPTPNLVVYQPLSKAFAEHAKMKKVRKLMQEEFYIKTNEFVKNGEYNFVQSYAIPSNIIYDIKARNEIVDIYVILQNKNFINMNINDLLLSLSTEKLKIKKVERNGSLIYNDINANEIKLQLNDIITVSGIYKDLFELVPKIGVQPVNHSIWNSISIYKKNEK